MIYSFDMFRLVVFPIYPFLISDVPIFLSLNLDLRPKLKLTAKGVG